LSKEDNIVRTTAYMPKYLHNKAKEAGINISKELTTYLETILFGDNTTDVKYQMDQLRDKKKTLEVEITTVNMRIKDLEKLLDEHDSKLVVEKKRYQRFVNHCRGQIKNSELGHISIDYQHLKSYWGKDYFSNNGMNMGDVKDILHRVKKDSFSFEDFQSIRRGGSLGV